MYAQICVIYEYTHTTDGDWDYSASYEYTQKRVGFNFERTNNDKKINYNSISIPNVFILKLFSLSSTYPFVFKFHIVVIENKISSDIQQDPKGRTQKLYYSLYQYIQMFKCFIVYGTIADIDSFINVKFPISYFGSP